MVERHRLTFVAADVHLRQELFLNGGCTAV